MVHGCGFGNGFQMGGGKGFCSVFKDGIVEGPGGRVVGWP